jgi:hypothetical protein
MQVVVGSWFSSVTRARQRAHRLRILGLRFNDRFSMPNHIDGRRDNGFVNRKIESLSSHHDAKDSNKPIGKSAITEAIGVRIWHHAALAK